MNDTLKVAGRIGAELGAAKAENARLRGLLREAEPYVMARAVGPMETSYLLQRIRAALSQQAEPAATPTDGVNWKAVADEQKGVIEQLQAKLNAQGEPAPAQDEREPIWGYAGTIGNLIAQLRTLDHDMEIYSPHRLDDGRILLDGLTLSKEWKEGRWLRKGDDAKRVAVLWTQPDARPAQTEQQPTAYLRASDLERLAPSHVAGCAASLSKEPGDGRIAIYAALIAQTAPQPEQSERDAVAEALASAEWPNVSIGNKALIMRAISLLSTQRGDA